MKEEVLTDKKKAFFKNVLKLSGQQLVEELTDSAMICNWRKGEAVVNIGDRFSSIHFLLQGMFRGYYVNRKGEEVTDCFGKVPGSPLVSCLDLEQPSPICLEFLEEGATVSVPAIVLNQLVYNNSEVIILYNKMLQHSLQMHWEIKRALSQYNAEERYEWFLRKYPGAVDCINHKYIASFLGMTPVTLSRVRAKLNAGKRTDIKR